MSPEEIADFLGLPWPLPEGRVIAPGIAEGLADVPPPGTLPEDRAAGDQGYMRCFRAFLRVAGPAPGRQLTAWDSGSEAEPCG